MTITDHATLALNGGSPTKATPYGTGRRFGEAELEHLREALEQNTLFYHFGKKVNQFTTRFGEMYGREHCVATSSGTASLHVAVGACGVSPGDEVITSPITDAGSYIGVLYQGAIPIFADLDPHSYNMTAETIAARITDRTKAVIVVHLAGNPAEMDEILELCRPRGIAVIEDCAQSYNTRYKGRFVGTIGDYGCFSTNDFKHISTGDGGMVLCEDAESYQKAFMFADKGYRRSTTGPATRDAAFLAPNYRMTELQGAVGLAQLERLDEICAARTSYGDRLREGIAGLPGLTPHLVYDHNTCTYWFTMFRIEEKAAGVSRDTFAKALQAEGVPCQAGYIPSVVYGYPMFTEHHAFERGQFPFVQPGRPDAVYRQGDCPVAEEILATAIKLSVNEFFTDDDLADTVAAIRKVSDWYAAHPEN